MRIEIFDKTKKRKILKELEGFGVKKINEMLVKTGNQRIKAFSGDLSKEEVYEIYRLFPIEGIGLYFAKDIVDRKKQESDLRLSVDALHLLSDQIKNNIAFLDVEQEREWFLGRDVELNEEQKKILKPKQFIAVRSKESDDFIGTAKTSSDLVMIFNYLPKERRRKN